MKTVKAEDKLVIGAEAIARECFNGGLNRRQVYLLKGWPMFRVGDLLAARPSAIKAEIERREQQAAMSAEGPN